MASRFWVGGSGNWDASSTTNWAATSGGASGASVPTSADDVTFDAASNTTAYTVTVTATANCKSLSFSAAPSVSGTVTFAGSSIVNVYGSFVGLSGMSWTLSGAMNFLSTAAGNTVTMNGVAFASTTTFVGSGGGWTLQDTFSVGNFGLQFGNGTLNTNGKTVSCGQLYCYGTLTRVLTLGTSTINCGRLGGNSWWVESATGITLSAASSTIVCATGGIFTGQGLTYGTLNYTSANATFARINGANTFGTLTISQGGATNPLSIYANQTVTGTLTITGTSITDRALIQSDTLGTARTITAATVSLTNVDFMDITGAGAASPFTGTSLGDCLGNSGITFTTAATQYWKTTTTGTKTWSTAGNWFLATNGGGGAGRVPLPQDDVVFDASSIGAASTTISADMPRLGKSINFTGVTNSPTLAPSLAHSLFGDLTLVSGMTFTHGSVVTNFCGRSSHTFTSAGKTFSTCEFKDFGGTYTLQDAVLVVTGFGLNVAGTVTTSFDVTATGVGCLRHSAGTLNMGAGTWLFTGVGSSNIPWNSSGGTLNAGSSTIKFTDSSSTGKTFASSGKTYNNFWFAPGAGTGTLNITGANTFNDFKDDGTAAHAILFTAGTTTTVSTWNVNGWASTGSDVKFALNFGAAGSHFTPDSVPISITGDLDMRAKVAFANWTTSAFNELIYKGTGSILSYLLRMQGGYIIIFWSEDGTTLKTAQSTVQVSATAWQALYVRSTLDVDNGAFGRDIKFWTSTDGSSWTQLGATVTQAGITSVYDSTASLFMGSCQYSGNYMDGRFFHGQVMASIGGSPVCNFYPPDFTSGLTWTASITGELWTATGTVMVSATNMIAIGSLTAASHTLTKTGGGYISSDYLAISRSTATPSTNTWWAGANSINSGNNSGWFFNALTYTTSAGAAAGVGTATGTGRAIWPVVGVAAGLATVTGFGGGLLSTVGNAAGVATVTGYGAAVLDTVGYAAGIATVTGVGVTFGTGVGVAIGLGTALGITTPVRHLQTGGGRNLRGPESKRPMQQNTRRLDQPDTHRSPR